MLGTFNYNLNSTFKFLDKIFLENGMYLFFPHFNEEIKNYKTILESSPTNDFFNKHFAQSITTGVKNDYYTMYWNIDKLTTSNEIGKIRTVDFNIHFTRLIFNSELIEQTVKDIVRDGEINEPILLAWYSPIDSFIIIDGNHRLQTAKKLSLTNIKARILTPDIHIKYMVNELCRNLYRIHHNLVMMQKFCIHPTSKFQYGDQYSDSTFYPIYKERNLNFLKLVIFKLYRFFYTDKKKILNFTTNSNLN